MSGAEGARAARAAECEARAQVGRLEALEREAAENAEVLTIAQVARRIRWSYDRTLAHLLAVNAQTGGMLLQNVSRGTLRPRWTVTIGALKQTHKQWFRTRALLEDAVDDTTEDDRVRVQLVDHKERIEQLERITDLHTAAIVNINGRRVA